MFLQFLVLAAWCLSRGRVAIVQVRYTTKALHNLHAGRFLRYFTILKKCSYIGIITIIIQDCIIINSSSSRRILQPYIDNFQSKHSSRGSSGKYILVTFVILLL